jgi:hypothetical protein
MDSVAWSQSVSWKLPSMMWTKNFICQRLTKFNLRDSEIRSIELKTYFHRRHFGESHVYLQQQDISFNDSNCTVYLFVFGATVPQWARASSFTRFLYHTQRRITVGGTPLEERASRRRDLYLTTHNTYNRQTDMPSVGFESTISAGERPQTHALDRAATGTGIFVTSIL